MHFPTLLLALCIAPIAASAEEPTKPVLEIPEPASMVVERFPFLHEKDVVGAAWSPDGKQLASFEQGGNVSLWSASTGTRLKSWDSKSWSPMVIAWSPDGNYLVTGDFQSAVAWDPKSGAEVRRIPHDSRVEALAFLPGTSTLVSAGTDGEIKMTNLSRGDEPRTLTSPCHGIRALAVSADGTKLAIGGKDPPAAILSLPGGEALFSLSPDSTSAVTWVGWSARKDQLFARFGEGTMLEYDATTGKGVEVFDRFGKSFWLALALVPGVDDLVGVYDSGYVFRGDARNHGISWSLFAPGASRTFVALSPDGTLAAIPWESKSIAIVATDSGHFRLGGEPLEYARFVAWSADGKTIFASRGRSEVHGFSARKGKRRRGFVAPGNQLLGLSARDDGVILAATFGGAWLRVTDLTNGRDLVREVMPQAPSFASLSEDGSTFAWWKDDLVHVRDLISLQELPSIPVLAEPQAGYATLSPHGDILMQFGTDRKRVVYTDTTTGLLLRDMSYAPRWPTAGILSPDGTRTALFESFGRLAVFASGQKFPIELTLNTKSLAGLRFSPDGRRIALLAPGYLVVYDSFTPQAIVDQKLDADAVALAWSPDGRFLATHHKDGVARVWRMPAPAPANSAQHRDPNLDWGDLACQRTDRAHEAASRLEGGGADAVAFLRVKFAEREDPAHIHDLVAQLGDESFDRRQSAREELQWLGVQAEPELSRALTGQPPGAWRNELEGLLRLAESRVGPSSQNLRRQRAMQVLEGIGSAESTDVLRHLSSESPSPRERLDAQDALRRVEMRSAK